MGGMWKRVAMRWSRAAKMPRRSWRASVGWPMRMPANGLFESMSAGLVNHDDHAPVPLDLLGFEQLLGLGHHFRLEEAGLSPERTDHGDVQAAGAEGRVGDVDHLVAEWVESGAGSPSGEGLAGSHLTGDDPQGRLLDAVEDASNRLLMGLAREQLGGGDRLREWRPGESEMVEPCGARSRRGSDVHDSSSPMNSWRKEMEPVSPASWSARTWPR